jgi:hypothetical protein
MKYITHENIGIDRVSVPWLIRKFVDPKAQFIFAPTEEVMGIAKGEGWISFDMHGSADIDHRGNTCSFEDALKKYNLTDPALQYMAKIIHGADITADAGTMTEIPGFVAIVSGFNATIPDDYDRLAKEWPMYDAIYAYCQKKVGTK